MAEIPVFDNDIPVAVPRNVLADPGAMARSAEALSHLGAAASAEFADFNARYLDARRAMDASNINAGLSAKLNDAQFRWSKTPDRQAALAGFNTEAKQLRADTLAGVSDPFVQRYVAQAFDREAIARSFETGREAFGLESQKRRGDLDTNLATFAQSAAAAGTPEMRALAIDNGMAAIHGAVEGGWENPEAGAKRVLQFKSDIAEVGARELLNSARTTGDADAAYDLVGKLQDPKNFPELTPEKREILLQRANIAADLLARRDATKQAREDAAAAKALKQTQTDNELQLLSDIYAGKSVPPGRLEDLAHAQLISPGGLEAAHSALQRAEEGRDDPRTAALLQAGIEPGGATTKDDVFNAMTAGRLKTTTGLEMLRTLNERGKQQTDAVERGAFATLKIITSGQAVEQGLIKDDSVRARAEQLWGQAQGEWNRRVIAGREDPMAVLSEMAPRYASAMPHHPSWLPQPKFGAVYSLDDVKKVYAATKSARESGQISDADLNNEARVLDAYRAFYAAAAARTSATEVPMVPGSRGQKIIKDK